MEKRLNLGIELIKKPHIIFLENIFHGLDLNQVRILNKILARIRNTGIIIVILTNTPNISSLVDIGAIYYVYEQQQIFAGSPLELRKRIQSLVPELTMDPLKWFFEEMDENLQK